MNGKTKDSELEDMLTELDPPYESKEELQIGHMLDQYGIPFFYKQPTIVYDQGKNEVWYPTFTLFCYDGLVIDYVAESGEQSRQDSILQKQQTYKYNRIPAAVLGPKYLDNPSWQESLYEKLEQSYHHPIEETNYIIPYNRQ